MSNKIVVPDNPAPRPDSSNRFEFGESANTPVTTRSSPERSAENTGSAPQKLGQ